MIPASLTYDINKLSSHEDETSWYSDTNRKEIGEGRIAGVAQVLEAAEIDNLANNSQL
jgi:hypothetical protein